MSAMQVGRVCVKTRGREAGKKCIIIDVVDQSFVLVTGPKALSGVKRRRANVNHIHPLDDLIKISKGASDEEVIKTLEEAGKTKDMGAELNP